MLIADINQKIRNKLEELEKSIEEMHFKFYGYYHGEETSLPNWEELERELLSFSQRTIYDYQLSKNLDRVLFKFQNRKKIWLKWVEEVHHMGKKQKNS